MKVIGLTGGIACGKTTVTEYLLSMGEMVLDTDKISRELSNPGSPALKEIALRFGPEFIDEEGNLKRRALGDYIFGDQEKLQILNSIFHPRIRARLIELIERKKAQGKDRVFLDVPLLFEAHMDDLCDEIWVVYLDPKTQLERLIKRDGMTAEIAKKRMDSQMAVDEKAKLGDYIIDNRGTIEETLNQVKELLKK